MKQSAVLPLQSSAVRKDQANRGEEGTDFGSASRENCTIKPVNSSGDKVQDEKQNQWKIPPGVAVFCMSKLFDSTGEAVHGSSLKEFSVSALSYGAIQIIVRDTFAAYREELASQSNSKSSCQGLSYKSLIPTSIDQCHVSVPNVRFRLSSSQGYETMGWSDVNLTVFKKPDRNPKMLNFALICLHVQVFGKEGHAYKILLKHSSKGL